MGTSASGGGAGNSNPLIPSWIPGGGGFPPPPNNDDSDGEDEVDDGLDKEDPDQIPGMPPGTSPNPLPAAPTVPPNRYTGPRKQFNKFVASGGHNRRAFSRALRGYSRNAAGSTSGLARRMTPSAIRVAGFSQAINAIRNDGLAVALTRLNLSEYIGGSVADILSALTDYIFRDGEGEFHDTQDDGLTKQAYVNAIVRICEHGDVDLENLSNENIEVMTAIFIEETIVQRVFTDIGNDMTRKESDIDKLVDIEEMAYQIVSGLVRNTIQPQVQAMQLGNQTSMRLDIENIYRIAFDTLSQIKN